MKKNINLLCLIKTHFKVILSILILGSLFFVVVYLVGIVLPVRNTECLKQKSKWDQIISQNEFSFAAHFDLIMSYFKMKLDFQSEMEK